MTAESEANMKRKIESLEKELDLSVDLQCAFPLPTSGVDLTLTVSLSSRPRQHGRGA